MLNIYLKNVIFIVYLNKTMDLIWNRTISRSDIVRTKVNILCFSMKNHANSKYGWWELGLQSLTV